MVISALYRDKTRDEVIWNLQLIRMTLGSIKNRIKNAFSSISIITYILVVIFGTGSWIAINALWVELPIIVQEIPERWSLPSYLTVIIQLANVAPLAFTLGNKFFPRIVREIPSIYISVLIGIAACALLAFFWKETSFVAGAERSTALLVLCFFLAMVNCLSSVTFLPYMATFRGVYMSPFFGGGGLGGLFPSLVALAQGVGGGSHTSCVNPTLAPMNTSNETSTNNTTTGSWGPGPKFSVEVFFWFLTGMMVACGLAFLGLNYLPVAKRQQVVKNLKGDDERAQGCEQAMELVRDEERENIENSHFQEDYVVKNSSIRSDVFLFVILALVSGLSNGVIPAIQSYACIPYSYYIYHLTLTLSNIANPVTSFMFPFMETMSSLVIGVLSCLYLGMCTYIIVVASQSPNVLLRCKDSGAALIVSICKQYPPFGTKICYDICPRTLSVPKSE